MSTPRSETHHQQRIIVDAFFAAPLVKRRHRTVAQRVRAIRDFYAR